eukprot:3099838-Amphidinium_carterae.3
MHTHIKSRTRAHVEHGTFSHLDSRVTILEESTPKLIRDLLVRFQHIHDKLTESDTRLAAEVKTLRDDVLKFHSILESVKVTAVDRMAKLETRHETRQDQINDQIENLRATTRQLQEIILLMYYEDDDDVPKKDSKPTDKATQEEIAKAG